MLGSGSPLVCFQSSQVKDGVARAEHWDGGLSSWVLAWHMVVVDMR